MRKAIGSILSVLALVILAVAGLMGRKVADWVLPPPQPGQFTKSLEDAVEKANRNLPVMIDEYTRHDRVTMPAPNTLQHHYTLIKTETAEDGDAAAIQQELSEMITKRACAMPATFRLLDRGIAHTYSYNAADGTFMGSVIVKRADCSR